MPAAHAEAPQNVHALDGTQDVLGTFAPSLLVTEQQGVCELSAPEASMCHAPHTTPYRLQSG